MTPELAEVIEAAKALRADERLEAAHQLLLSVDHDDTAQLEIDEGWDAEVARRVQGIVDGTATLADGRAAHDAIRAEFLDRDK